MRRISRGVQKREELDDHYYKDMVQIVREYETDVVDDEGEEDESDL